MNSTVNLDEKQKKAINFTEGPLLIIAGAGTGKTTVITQRIKHLIVEKDIQPQQILALTFTEKAAHEMQERVDVLLPYGYTNIWIHTFHSFCDRILRDEAHTIGLDPNYKLISEAEAVLLLKQNIFELGLKIFKPLGNPNKFLDALLVHFSRLKDEDITPKDYLNFAEKIDDGDEKNQSLELAIAYQKYEDLKMKNSYMDFADLISNTLQLFRARPNILKKYQSQFKYILVDEFQDTNFAQNELAMLLTGKENNINVVADDDQSIYRFRGAAVSNVLQFRKNFPNTQIITLVDNYRSTQKILNSSYQLIQHNNPNRLEIVEKINKKLVSHSKLSDDIEFIHTARSEDEADEIAKTIKKLTKKNYDYKDIAILVRANNHAQAITSALARLRIPYQFLGPGYLFQQEEIKDLIAYVNFLTNLSDSISLYRVLSMDIFNISYIQLNYLLNFAKRKNLSLFEALNSGNLTFLNDETQEKLINISNMINNHLAKIKHEQAGQILYDFLIDSKLFDTFMESNSLKEEKRVQNIAKFFDRIKSFEAERTDANIFTLREWLNLMMQMGDSPLAADIDQRNNDSVNILTVHSSKGLEFPVVFIVNLVSDRFPTRERVDKIPLPEKIIKEKLPQEIDFHLEEERRLFYVGMTRAKEKLFLTAADYYGTGKRTKKISQFIFEALPELKMTTSIKQKTEQLSLPEIFAPYQQEEEMQNTKQNLTKVNYITYSNLQAFDICPLHYKAKVIFSLPTPPSAVLSFGISLHKTLYDFYKLVMENQKPDLEKLKSLLKNDWENDGYENKKHEEERLTQAEEILEKFYDTECCPAVKPLKIEEPFNFMLKNGIKVFGKIDRIDQTENGIEIIDYKTGADNPKADAAHKLQLGIYALAITKIKDPILNVDPKNITLTLHFLEANSKKSVTFTKDELEKLEDEIINQINDIEKSDFKCSKNIICQNCEYKMLCNGN